MPRRELLRLGATGALLAGVNVASPAAVYAADDYKLGPDSQPQDGVPQGEVKRFRFTESRLFPGTERDVWVYVPKQYDGTTPACVMVFQDGGGFQDRNGGYRVPVVFDNLIHRKEMPVTVAVFVNPGAVPAADDKAALPRYNRSFEYDGMGDRYARFLLDELLPDVQKRFDLKLTDAPAGRGLCGASSGGSCSFTAAWERPDAFGKVISFIGSFTDLHGAHNYATMVRKREPKPIRVFLQDGSNDQDIYAGSWFLSNSDLAAALRFAGYDSRYVVGDGGHNGRHGGSILPDALRWLWRDYPGVTPTVTSEPPPPSRQPLRDWVIAGADWEPVGNVGTGLVVDMSGAIQPPAPNEKSVALVAGADGTLITYDGRRKSLVRDGREIVSNVATAPLSLTLAPTGTLFWSDGKDGRLWSARADGKEKPRLLSGVPAEAPRFGAVSLTPDRTLLIAAPHPDSASRWAWSFRVTAEGVADGQPYFDLFVPYGAETAGVRGLAYDDKGWLYAATPTGIQVLDQAGRVNGILAPPVSAPPTALAFAGENLAFLHCVAGGQVWRRRLNVRGVHPAAPALRPPPPRL
jgi:enterochelin esterase-like enzyme